MMEDLNVCPLDDDALTHEFSSTLRVYISSQLCCGCLSERLMVGFFMMPIYKHLSLEIEIIFSMI